MFVLILALKKLKHKKDLGKGKDLMHLASSNLIYRYNVFALDVIWLKTTVFLYFNLLHIRQPTVADYFAALRCPRDIIYFSLEL